MTQFLCSICGEQKRLEKDGVWVPIESGAHGLVFATWSMMIVCKQCQKKYKGKIEEKITG